MINNEPKLEPPNGGFGWAVVAGVSLINIFNQSILSVFGLLFGEHLKDMNEQTTGAALITNINSLALNFSGFLIGPALKKYSPRTVALTGCLLTSSGLLLCSVSTKLWHMIIAYSLFVGVGLGLISPSAFMAINSYFTTRRGRAVGISLAGTGIGQMFIPHLVRVLLDNYGYKITVLVMGVLALSGLFGAMLFRPLNTVNSKKHNNMKDIKLLLDVKNSKHEYEIKIVHSDDMQKEPKKKSKLRQVVKSVLKRLASAMDLELLKDPIFLSIIIGIGLVYTSTLNFSMLFPYFLQYSTGLSRFQTAYCMSALAGADNLFRLLLPFVTDKTKCPYRAVFLFGVVGMVIARTLLAESTDFRSLIIYSSLFGFMKSATVLNNNLTISDYCTPEKLPGGLGLNMISKGILVITAGQFLGFIRDFSNSYVFCLHIQNFLLLIVIVFWLPELIYKYYKYSHKETDKTQINNEEECKKLNNEV